MTRDELIIDFLKGLRIALNNAAAYNHDHPYFVKSVEVYKEKLDALLVVFSPVQITATPDSLFVDGRTWEKNALYSDLAQLFHFRKIKSVIISAGISLEELRVFVGTVGLPKKEIVRKGGINLLLSGTAHPHISFEELDYSQFLSGSDTEVDVWVYMLKQALEKEDRMRLMQFADNFGKVVGKLKLDELTGDDDLRRDVSRFISYLKEHHKGKLRECAQTFFAAISRYKDVIKSDNIDKIKMFFKDLNENELGELLWDEMSHDESFDATSLNLFSQITSGRDSGAIAGSLSASAGPELAKASPAVFNRITKLMQAPDRQSLSEVYQNTIASLAKRITPKENITFVREQLKVNYRYHLLTFLDCESDAARLQAVTGRLVRDWESILKEGDCEYLALLAGVVRKRKKDQPALSGPLEDIEKRVTQFAEAAVWSDVPPPGIEALIDVINISTRDLDFYLERIFSEGRVNPLVLTLFFRFFFQELPVFYRAVESKRHDVNFLMKFTRSLQALNLPLAQQTLKHIFSISNEFIKIEMLKGMRSLSPDDEEFLVALLRTGDIHLKRGALAVLAKSPSAGPRAAAALFDIPNFLGSKNNLLLEHMALTDEFNLEAAREYLVVLGNRKLFWYAAVKARARRILEKWNAGKH